MSNLIAVAFQDEQSAFKMREKLVAMQKEYLIQLEDAVVVTKDKEGKAKLHQAVNLTAVSALGGTFWGMLIGMLFLSPLLGAAVGAGAGAITGALSDIGIDDNFMKGLSSKIQPGGAILFVLVRKATMDKVLDGLKGFSGTIIQTSLTKDSEEELRQVLSSPAMQAHIEAQTKPAQPATVSEADLPKAAETSTNTTPPPIPPTH